MAGKYQVMPDLTPEEYAALRADIREHGVQVPVVCDEYEEIIDGHHRVKACQELGITEWPRDVYEGLTEAEKRNMARRLNLNRRHMGKDARDAMMRDMRADGAHYSEIADAAGMSVGTAYAKTHDVELFNSEKLIGADGKKRPPAYAPREIEERTEEPKVYQPMAATVFSHKSLEYYTPTEILDAARELMGGIDLDPASCEAAQVNVRAARYFTKEDDGLAQEWSGRVWLNPPYSKTNGRSNQDIWSSRLQTEYERGRVDEAVLLVKAALGYKWFESLWRECWTCLVESRLSFILEDGEDEGQSKQGTALIYFGQRPLAFRAVFSRFGRIIPPEAILGTLLEQY